MSSGRDVYEKLNGGDSYWEYNFNVRLSMVPRK